MDGRNNESFNEAGKRMGGEMNISERYGAGVLALLAVTTLSLSACHRHYSPAERAEWVANKVSKDLSLDEQQKVKLDAVKQAFLTAQGEMRKQHEAILDEVMAQLPTDRLDQAKLLQLFEQHQALATRMAPSLLNTVAEFHVGLTQKQKADAVEELTRLRDRMRERDSHDRR